MATQNKVAIYTNCPVIPLDVTNAREFKATTKVVLELI